MSRPYGPVPLTAGVVTFQDIDPGAAWVVIENSSLAFDIGVCFQVNSPPPVTSFSGPPWDGVIQAGGWRKFQLPSTENNRQWTGRGWLLPINVSKFSAATGTISGYARVYMTTYLPGEEPADAPTIVRGLDIVSQPRVISLPMTPAFSFSNQLQMNTGEMSGFFPNTVAVTDPASDPGCVVFVYYASVNTSAVVGAATFSIRLDFRDSAFPFGSLGTLDLLFGMVGAAANVGDEWQHDPANGIFNRTLLRGGILPANTGEIRVDFFCLGAT